MKREPLPLTSGETPGQQAEERPGAVVLDFTIPEEVRRTRPTYEQNHEFYHRLVGLDQIPKARVRPDSRVVGINIVNDHTLTINDGPLVKLTGRKLFIFNALLTNLGRDTTRKDIEALGYGQGMPAGSRNASISISKKELEEALASGSTAGEVLLRQKYDRGKVHFRLNPNLEFVFSDHRAAESPR